MDGMSRKCNCVRLLMRERRKCVGVLRGSGGGVDVQDGGAHGELARGEESVKSREPCI